MNDLVNGLFELVAGIAAFYNCYVIRRDKMVRGVSIASTFFFTSWGAWNLYYYPSLDQTLSFYGGVVIFAANALYVYLLLSYRRN